MAIKINKREVDAIPIPATGKVYVFDADIKGFGVVVTSTGVRSYFVQYRPGVGGRNAAKRRYTIGKHGSPWTPDTARTEAKRILGLAAEGKDPAGEKQTVRHREGTLINDVFLIYLDRYAKVRQKSWRETERVFDLDVLPRMGGKDIADVGRLDIVNLIDAVSDRGPIMANRTLAYVRKFFNWTIERGYITASPCAGIKPPGVAKARERSLDDDELAEVWKAAETLGDLWMPWVKLLILTAQRREEVVGMQWSELDLEKGILALPGARTKNKRAHEVPLVKTACDLLLGRPHVTTIDPVTKKEIQSPFVFTTTGRTAVSGLSKVKMRIDIAIAAARVKALKEAGGNPDDVKAMPGWCWHDLRRTATTGMARLGIHPHVADAILNHKTGSIQGVAAIYNRHAYTEERRRALEAWERHVLGLVTGKAEGDNVIHMNRKETA